MSNVTIALLFGIGVSGWVYAKAHHSTGGNITSSLIAAAAVGFLSFVALLIILGMIFKQS